MSNSYSSALKLLGEPRQTTVDLHLVIKAENKRYTLSDYSDAHWIFSILWHYQNDGNIVRTACEMILNSFVNTGIIKAKELESKLSPLLPCSWIKLENGNWDETREKWNEVKRYLVDGD